MNRTSFALIVSLIASGPMLACSSADEATLDDGGKATESAPEKEASPDGNATDRGIQDAGSGTEDPPATNQPARRCDPNKPFGKPVPVAGIARGNSASLSRDELTIYYAVASTAYVATRPDKESAFGKGKAITELKGAELPHVGNDGLSLVYQNLSATRDVFETRRATSASPFGAATKLFSVPESGGLDVAPSLSDDGNTVMYRHAVKNLGPYYLYWSVNRAKAVPIPGVTEAKDPWHPVLSADGLTLYFANRNSPRDFSIWVARRAATDKPFSDVHPVEAFAETGMKAGMDVPNWLSPDGCVLYMSGAMALDFDGVRVARRPL